MAKYLRSTDGSDTDNGSTWALSKATLVGAVGTAGETVYVSQAHAETQASGMTIAFAGNPANPNVVLCGNDGAEPPTTEAATATVSTTGQANIAFTGSGYVKGLIVQCGNGANYSNLSLNAGGSSAIQGFESCILRLNDSHPSSTLNISASDGAAGYETELTNTLIKFTNQSHLFALRGKVNIRGGGFEAGTTSPYNAFYLGGTGAYGDVRIDGFDFSNLSSAFTMFYDAGRPGHVVVSNCKLPAGWSANGLVASVNGMPAARYELYNATPSGGSAIPFKIQDFCGSITHEATIVKAAGSAIGSAKMVTSADAKEANGGLALFDMYAEATSGAALSATVEILHDSATNLTNAEMWLEVHYLGTGGKAIMASSHRANSLAAATDIPASTATWTTTGLATPNKQNLTVSFTPQVAGLVRATVRLAKASKTVFVDAKLTVA